VVKKRKNYTAEEKVLILKDHLVNKTSVSDLCDQYGIHPTLFYKWQKLMFENMSAALESKGDAKTRQLQKENNKLREKIVLKDGVIAEIMEDYIAVKKSDGVL